MGRGLNKNEALQQLSLLCFFNLLLCVCVPAGECVCVYVYVTLIQSFLKFFENASFFFFFF